MRRILTSGIKAILAIAALSTAAHWAMRVQREPTATAKIPDPAATGSITPRKLEAAATAPAASMMQGLDQQHLAKLISGASTEKPKAPKQVAKR